MTTPRRLRLAAVLLAVATTLAACGTTSRECTPIPFSSAAESQYEAARDRLTFAPLEPCSTRSDLQVARILSGTVAARPPEPRISFIVERRGVRAFTLSATRAELPFRDIPRNTRPLRARAGDSAAAGFEGPATTGETIAYLRWRTAGVTYELAATLHPWFTAEDVQAIATALMHTGVTESDPTPEPTLPATR